MHRRICLKNGLGVSKGLEAPRTTRFINRLRRVIMSQRIRLNTLILGASVATFCIGGVGLLAQNTLPVPPPGGKAVTRAIGQAPGLESFAVQPETPMELIDAIDYLIRVGREDQALPLAQRLVALNPDKETLIEIRHRIGSAKLLSLQSTQSERLRSVMARFAGSVAQASAETALDEGRILGLIKLLSASREESELAAERLSRVGSPVVGSFIKALTAPDISPKTRRDIQFALNELETSALPGLIGALRHPDPKVRSAMVEALGSIGDARALPWMVYQSTRKDEAGPVAQSAVLKLNNGQSIDKPAQYLINESATYLDREVHFVSNQIELWFWDNDQKKLLPITLDKNVAEGAIGYRLAKMALDLDPTDQKAQTIALSTLLQEESDRLGQAFPDQDPSGVWAMALASGPQTLENVLKRAMGTGRHERLATMVLRALSQVVTTTDLATPSGRPHILVQALTSPDRRVQFAAAKALVELDPTDPFPGSSRVVPVLSRFLQTHPAMPRAVVIHNNLGEGSNWISYLKKAGYDATLETSGRDGFSEIARRGDAELVLISTQLDPTSWTLPETISNIKADSRTSGVPVIVVGPLDAKSRLQTLLGKTPGLGFMVSPANQTIADRQIAAQLKKLGMSPLSSEERVGLADESSELIRQLMTEKGPNAMTAMLGSLEPHVYRSLKASLEKPEEQDEWPNRDQLLAQVLQESAPKPDRSVAALQLSGEIQRTGVGLKPAELQKVNALFIKLEQQLELELRETLASLVGVNKPDARTVGEIFLKFAPPSGIYESIQKKQ
jgi:HEAT repeat protein